MKRHCIITLILLLSVPAYLLKILETLSEWQSIVWYNVEKAKQNKAPAKNEPNTIFSERSLGKGLDNVTGFRKMYNATQTKAMKPRRCVQIFPVSVWIWNILLKQSWNDFNGGRWPCIIKSLSRSHSGSSQCETSIHPRLPASITWRANRSACSAASFTWIRSFTFWNITCKFSSPLPINA